MAPSHATPLLVLVVLLSSFLWVGIAQFPLPQSLLTDVAAIKSAALNASQNLVYDRLAFLCDTYGACYLFPPRALLWRNGESVQFNPSQLSHVSFPACTGPRLSGSEALEMAINHTVQLAQQDGLQVCD
jgi:hypothetical protein